MSLIEVLLIAVSLSFDCFVLAVGGGAQNRVTFARSLKVAAVFGGFHALMPLIGWLGASAFYRSLIEYGSMIGFALLLLIGLKMLKDGLGPEDAKQERSIFRTRTLLPLALVTSIDALVIGVSFTFIGASVPRMAVVIGLVAFFATLAGIWLGNASRHLLGTRIELAGALILIALAFKVLLM